MIRTPANLPPVGHRRAQAATAALLVLFLLFMLTFSLFVHTGRPARSAAALPKLSTIRVALFIDADKLKQTAAAVTLSAERGLVLGARTKAGTGIPLSPAAQPVRASLDRHRIRWPATDQFAEAKMLRDKLASLNQPSVIFRRTLQGKTVFEVFTGPYASDEAAQAAMAKLIADGSIAALLKGAGPAIAGPHHASAGEYREEAAALNRLESLRQAGIAADLALAANADGSVSYIVLALEEPDATRLAAAMQAAQTKLPNLALKPVDPTAPYVLSREDVTDSADGKTAIGHYLLGSDTVLVAKPAQADEGIKVREREERLYRGSIEVGAYRGSLAVINEVDFEQYLYSVVSTEMGKGWPLEALKAQAVAARTYALKQGVKYEIAHISDSTLDQAYYGMGAEIPEAVQAVQATAGQVLADADGLILPMYSANAGGKTADPSEVYGLPAAYLKSVDSPDDYTGKEAPAWHYVMLQDGRTGYISSEFVRNTGTTNGAGFAYYEPTGTSVNVRPLPKADNRTSPPFAKVNPGDRLLSLGVVPEAGPSAWVAGPFDPDELLEMINRSAEEKIAGPLKTLEVSQRGPSGRVIEIRANGQPVKVKYPDEYRRVFGGLPSTKFVIEQTGRYTILGAGGATTTAPQNGQPVYAAQAGGRSAQPLVSPELYVMGGEGTARAIGTGPSVGFVFRGTGNGHGLGLSQWGARGLAAQGYDYRAILLHYYSGVNIVKVE
jgi:stage II sporulation protein D